jgi:hypothetical protein
MKNRIALATVGMALVSMGWLFLRVDRSTAADKQDGGQETKVAKFMRAKLASSQNVLEGLVTEDFKLIEDGAQKMKVMSLAAEWQVIEGPIYAQYSAEFRRSADRLIQMSKDKNTDGAALSYVHLTLTCISCHKFVRSVAIASGEELPPGLERALVADDTLLRNR